MSKIEQAARQLLEVAEGIQHGTDWNNGTHAKIYRPKFPAAITALREALEQLNCQCGDKCFPVFSGDIEYCETCGKPTALAEQAEQEPVAEVVLRNQTVGFGRTEKRKDIVFLADVEVGTKLYAKSQQQALDEQVHTPYCKQAPMCKTPCGNSDCVEQAEQEPVHWVVPDFGFLFPSEDAAQRYLINIESDARPTPCYAAPVRTKDLTDEEIAQAVGSPLDEVYLADFRAVIAADREKNK